MCSRVFFLLFELYHVRLLLLLLPLEHGGDLIILHMCELCDRAVLTAHRMAHPGPCPLATERHDLLREGWG